LVAVVAAVEEIGVAVEEAASVALAEEAPAAAVLVVVGNCIGKIYIKNGSASFEGTPIFIQ
jgi:hypothetical protein